MTFSEAQQVAASILFVLPLTLFITLAKNNKQKPLILSTMKILIAIDRRMINRE